MWRLLRALPLVALLPGCAGDRPRQEAPASGQEVEVERHPDLQETTYSAATGDCAISWTVYGSEANRGVIRHRPECGLPLGEQAPLIAQVLRKVMETAPEATGFRTLSWGRLYPDSAADPTMAERLAQAAVRSSDWDTEEGRPRAGDVNGWIRGLANDTSIFEELRSLFRDAGLGIRLSSVEKVLVERADRLPFFEALRVAGAREGDKVPYDCQAWFSVVPLGEPDREGRR